MAYRSFMVGQCAFSVEISFLALLYFSLCIILNFLHLEHGNLVLGPISCQCILRVDLRNLVTCWCDNTSCNSITCMIMSF